MQKINQPLTKQVSIMATSTFGSVKNINEIYILKWFLEYAESD